MRRKITALVFILGAIIFLALWGYGKTSRDAKLRFQLALHGIPFPEVRHDVLGSRPDGNDHNAAYRKSVYSREKYVGYIERWGYFIPFEKKENPFPMFLSLVIYQAAPYLSVTLLIFGLLILRKPSNSENSSQRDGKASNSPPTSQSSETKVKE